MNLKDSIKLYSLKGEYSLDDINKRYRSLCKKHHPDVGGSEDLFSKVLKARDILKDSLEDKAKCQLCRGTKISIMFCEKCNGQGSLVQIKKINGIPSRKKTACDLCFSTGKVMCSCILCSKDKDISREDIEKYILEFNS